MRIQILHEDNHILGINKPAGMLSQGDRTGDESVVTVVKKHLKDAYAKPGNVYLGLVHRLDRPVSGTMIVARTSKAARRLSVAFRENKPQKHYFALVRGHLSGVGHWQDYLVKVKRSSRVVSGRQSDAKLARLSWNVLGQKGDSSLVQVELHTGRPHQIRCQFAHRGFPVLGDFRYGATRPFRGRNIALHSSSLIVSHPVKREPIKLHAPVPDYWPEWVKNISGTINR